MTSNGNGADFRAAAGLAGWQDPGLSGPGLFEVTGPDGHRTVTNVRKIAGRDGAPGSALIGWAGWLLTVLAGGLLFVSFAGQYAYLLTARHQTGPALVAALMFDAGMIIFSLLALGLARAGKPARAERAWIVACAAGSAAMNYAAADVSSPRSVAAFVVPPLFLAVVVDRVVAVVRRHVLGGDEASPWAAAGRFAVTVVRVAGVAGLYGLRLVLAPRETPRGLRRMVLDAAPLPASPARGDTGQQVAVTAEPAVPLSAPETAELPPPVTKKAKLISLYQQHPDYENEDRVSPVATELAGVVGMHPSNARKYLYKHVKDRLR